MFTRNYKFFKVTVFTRRRNLRYSKHPSGDFQGNFDFLRAPKYTREAHLQNLSTDDLKGLRTGLINEKLLVESADVAANYISSRLKEKVTEANQFFQEREAAVENGQPIGDGELNITQLKTHIAAEVKSAQELIDTLTDLKAALSEPKQVIMTGLAEINIELKNLGALQETFEGSQKGSVPGGEDLDNEVKPPELGADPADHSAPEPAYHSAADPADHSAPVSSLAAQLPGPAWPKPPQENQAVTAREGCGEEEIEPDNSQGCSGDVLEAASSLDGSEFLGTGDRHEGVGSLQDVEACGLGEMLNTFQQTTTSSQESSVSTTSILSTTLSEKGQLPLPLEANRASSVQIISLTPGVKLGSSTPGVKNAPTFLEFPPHDQPVTQFGDGSGGHGGNGNTNGNGGNNGGNDDGFGGENFGSFQNAGLLAVLGTGLIRDAANGADPSFAQRFQELFFPKPEAKKEVLKQPPQETQKEQSAEQAKAKADKQQQEKKEPSAFDNWLTSLLKFFEELATKNRVWAVVMATFNILVVQGTVLGKLASGIVLGAAVLTYLWPAQIATAVGEKVPALGPAARELGRVLNGWSKPPILKGLQRIVYEFYDAVAAIRPLVNNPFFIAFSLFSTFVFGYAIINDPYSPLNQPFFIKNFLQFFDFIGFPISEAKYEFFGRDLTLIYTHNTVLCLVFVLTFETAVSLVTEAATNFIEKLPKLPSLPDVPVLSVVKNLPFLSNWNAKPALKLPFEWTFFPDLRKISTAVYSAMIPLLLISLLSNFVDPQHSPFAAFLFALKNEHPAFLNGFSLALNVLLLGKSKYAAFVCVLLNAVDGVLMRYVGASQVSKFADILQTMVESVWTQISTFF